VDAEILPGLKTNLIMNNPSVMKVGSGEGKRRLGNGPSVSFFAFDGKHIIGM
jgi:hypothetical protein